MIFFKFSPIVWILWGKRDKAVAKTPIFMGNLNLKTFLVSIANLRRLTGASWCVPTVNGPNNYCGSLLLRSRTELTRLTRKYDISGPNSGGFCPSETISEKKQEDPEVECSQQYLNFCLSLLPKIVDQSLLKRMPVTENEIESLCHGFDVEMNCFDLYARKCLIPRERQLIEIHSSGAKNIYKYLCNDKLFRSEYLKHTRCFRGTQSDWESCVGRFVRIFKDEIENQNTTQETRVFHTCCAIYGFSRCVFVPGTMKCERDDALFLLKLTEISIDRQEYYRECSTITNYTLCLGCTLQAASFVLLSAGFLLLGLSQ